jgi:hypothetical protein
LKQLDALVKLAPSVDTTMAMFENPEKLPDLDNWVKDYLLDKLFSYSKIPLNKAFAKDAGEEDMSIWEYIPFQNKAAKGIRNRFAHGCDISEQELIQFVSFCNRIKEVAKETQEWIRKKLKKENEN